MIGQNADGGPRGFLTTDRYRQLRRAAETYRGELVVRLCGEVGLRPAEVAAIKPADVETHDRNGRTHYFLTVPCTGDAATNGDGASRTTARRAYLPEGVEHDLRQYVRTAGIDDDERVVPVTPRRVQMLVGEIAKRVADRTGDERFEEVSSRTLRQHFARQLLSEEQVHPTIVAAVGGWDRVASLEAFLPEPTADDIALAFERTAVSSPGSHELDAETLVAAVKQSGHAVYVIDPDGVVAYANQSFADATGLETNAVIGRQLRTVFETEESAAEAPWTRLDADEEWTGTFVAERPDGKTRRFEGSLTPVTVDDETAWYVGVCRGRRAARDTANQVPERLDAVLDRVQAVGDVLTASSKRGEIERRTCEQLAAGDAYAFAWATSRSGESFTCCASAGIETVPDALLDAPASATALETGRIVATDDVTEADVFEPWADHADGRAYAGAAAIPITDGDTTYGVLHLATASPGAFGERERAVLADLGDRIGQALTAAERRRLLLADTIVELTFRSTDWDSFFVTASAEFDCEFTLQGVVPGTDGALLYFVTLEGAEDEAVLQWAAEQSAVEDVRLVRDYGDEALLELVVTGDEVSKRLTEQGATVQEMTVAGGVQEFVGAMPTDADVRETVSVLTDAYPETQLVTKREREKPTEATAPLESSLADALTEKQAAVVRAAHHAGYFEWPRGSTAEELADSMGITSPTLHNHLRRGLQKLIETFIDEGGRQPHAGEIPWADD